MKRILLSIAAVLAFGACGFAQDIKIPVNIDKLSAKAAEVVDVNLDGATLNFARKFLASEGDDREAEMLVRDLKGIYVRSFEFDKAGEFSESDVDEVRAQLKSPLWARIVNVRSNKDGEKVDVFLKMEGEKVVGLALIAVEPKELTIVNLVGPIDPEKLSELGGHFGIPKVESTKSTPKPAPKATPKPAPKAQ